MSVGSVSNGASAAGSAGSASYLSSPAVQMAQLQDSSLSMLLGESGGSSGDSLAAFTSTAVAMPLFQQPGLLTGLTRWDGSLTPGSERVAADDSSVDAGSGPTNSPAASPFSFNPFDQASWWTDPKGSNLDTVA